jgi:hypothetical protein
MGFISNKLKLRLKRVMFAVAYATLFSISELETPL